MGVAEGEVIMTSTTFGSFARLFAAGVLGASLALAGCAAETPAETEGSSEAALTGAKRIAVAPPVADVVREYMKMFTADFEKARQAHPNVRTITKESLDEFAKGAGEIDTCLGTYFFDEHVSSIA